MSQRRYKTSRHQAISRIKTFFRAFAKNRQTKQWLGAFLIFVGALLFVFPSVYHTWSNRPAQISGKNDFGPIKIDQKLLGSRRTNPVPLRIIIPQINIDLAVIEAPVINGYWETSETTASHGMGSANPGENGNIVIFAHAREGLFLPLSSIKKYVSIYIFTNTAWHAYRVRSIQDVTPQNTTVISPTDSETLTLFTCSGFLDSKRLVVTAQPDQL